MWKTRLSQAIQPLRQAVRARTSQPAARQPLRQAVRARTSQPAARRLNSTKPPSPPQQPSPSTAESAASPAALASKQQQSRADRILSRLPRSMQGYAGRLRSAPVSHVVAFLVLHELTAVVPLLGLFGLFHYGGLAATAPVGYVTEHYGSYVREGAARFERYFTRKGWFGFGKGEDGEGVGGEEAVRGFGGEGEGDEAVMRRWEDSNGKYRVVVEIALAYAITKALLPARIVVSLWATPWFAGVMGRIRRVLPLSKGLK